MSKPLVLIVEDAAPLAALYQQYLLKEDVDVRIVDTATDAKTFISDNVPTVVLLDLNLPDLPGQEVLKWLNDEKISTNVIVVTSNTEIDMAVKMMRLGAHDFLTKPIDAQRLCTTVSNVLENSRLKHIVQDFQQTFARDRYHNFIGTSLPMQTVYRIIDSVASSKAPVFITGESGTGKEVCAEAIHQQGSRSEKPFIAINCGAIPHDLMESEIFGHVKGAFTGAASDRRGAASLADGGTLFLDEIGEMELDLQTKLLRFVQTGKFQKVGGNKEESVDIRFICATNKDPLESIANGTFREDLYYRLHVVPIQLPPLRERGEDILSIANEFLSLYAKEEGKSFDGFDIDVEAILLQYTWPGNVRQLQNVIRNIVVLHNDTSVKLAHLPAPLDSVTYDTMYHSQTLIKPNIDNNKSSLATEIRPLAEVEREMIEQAVAFCGDNIPKAAALLEVSPSTIYRKIQAWEKS